MKARSVYHGSVLGRARLLPSFLRSKTGPLSLLLWTLRIVALFWPTFSLLAQCDLTWYQFTSANSPGLIHLPATAYDSRRGVAVLFGGEYQLPGTPYSSDTWEWSNATWTRRDTAIRPHARKKAAMAYDSDRGVCVLFGGGTNLFEWETPFNDTWEWNGSSWSLRKGNDPSFNSDRPPPLEEPMMVYDSLRKRIVMLGVSEHVGREFRPSMRTWEWDGNIWTVHDRFTSPTPAPPPRSGAAMAFDSARGVTVVFGGTAYGVGTYLNDTWTWDGTNWTLAATGGARARRDHAIAFDARRKVIVLFGGSDPQASQMGETSEWDGKSWKYFPFADLFNFVGGRQFPKMWYDTIEQRVILFGGRHKLATNPGHPEEYEYLDAISEARPPGYWVDFNYPGVPSLRETGKFPEPFNTVAEAVNAAPPGCTLILKPGVSFETVTISKPLFLEAYSTPVAIGVKTIPQ